jgi:HK97 family phage prohead protease
MRKIDLTLRYNDLDAEHDAGTFAGLASVYNNVDSYGDVVVPGAFTKTLAKNGGQVVILNQHDAAQPIGIGTLKDDPSGLHVAVELNLGTHVARDVYSNLKAGIINGLSIGFVTVRDRVVKGVREILEVDLWEVSVVTFPANARARVSGVKGLTPRALAEVQRVAQPYQHAIRHAAVAAKQNPERVEQALRMTRWMRDLTR